MKFQNDVIHSVHIGEEGLIYMIKKSKGEVHNVDLIAIDTLGSYKHNICSFKDPYVKCFSISKFAKGQHPDGDFELLMGTGSDLQIMKLLAENWEHWERATFQ